jgi:hypothetical protein
MTNEECQQMQHNVLEYLRNDATDGDKAIVTMLTMLLNQMNDHEARLERIALATEQVAKQFNQVSGGGHLLMVEQS